MSEEMTNVTAEANEDKLTTLAAEINTIKRQTQQIMMQAAVEIGRRLVEAKAAVGHGNWGGWLQEHVDYSERTAQNLIRIFKEYGDDQMQLFGRENPKALADLTYTQAVALLGIKDADERAEFVETHDVPNMTSRELADAIRERDEARGELAGEQKKREAAEAKTKTLQHRVEELEKTVVDADEADDTARKEIEALQAKLKEAEENRDISAEEIRELRAKVADMEKAGAAPAADLDKAAFAGHFEIAKKSFNGMLEVINRVEDGEKYRAALVKMLNAMIAAVQG